MIKATRLPTLFFFGTILLSSLMAADMGIDVEAFVVVDRHSVVSTTSPIISTILKRQATFRNNHDESFQRMINRNNKNGRSSTGLFLASNDGEKSSSSNLPFWLDPGTRGGAIFLSFVLFLLPLIGYSVVTSVFGADEVEAGKWIGVGFTAVATVLWVSTYIFRVATKDMTYVSDL
jgi:hypothetical protein